jgi:AcrR family transcriptional regulator
VFRFARGVDVTDRTDRPGEAREADGGHERPVRADARRNLDSLLKAALDVFATSGVDAPVREIADKAGVGVGTLYRHFPQRSDLIKAVVRNEMDACADAAVTLAAEHEPGEALSRWMLRFTDFIMAKRGLAAALHSGDPAYHALPVYFEQRMIPALQGLLDRAVAAGAARGDIEASELLRAGAQLSNLGQGDDPATTRRMLALLVDGLRYGAGVKG